MLEGLSTRIAGPDDIELVTRTIALAFSDDPVWGPAMGGPRTTIEQRTALWRIFVRGAVRYPRSGIVGEGAAVSIWIPPRGAELDEPQELDLEQTLLAILLRNGAAQFQAPV